MWNGCLLPLLTFLSLDISSPNVAHSKPLACWSDIHWTYGNDICPSSLPQRKGKKGTTSFFLDLSQLSTRGRNPTMLFYSFMPITTNWSYDLLDWMDGWMTLWRFWNVDTYCDDHMVLGVFITRVLGEFMYPVLIYSHGSQTFEKV